MISIDTAKRIVNCYLRTARSDTELFKNRSEVRQFVKWLKLVLDESIPNELILNNRSMDELLQKLALSINKEDAEVLARLCIVYEGMTHVHLGGLLDQIRSGLEFKMNDFLDEIINEVHDSIGEARNASWIETKKLLNEQTGKDSC